MINIVIPHSNTTQSTWRYKHKSAFNDLLNTNQIWRYENSFYIINYQHFFKLIIVESYEWLVRKLTKITEFVYRRFIIHVDSKILSFITMKIVGGNVGTVDCSPPWVSSWNTQNDFIFQDKSTCTRLTVTKLLISTAEKEKTLI